MTNRKSSHKLSAREDRELREVEAARNAWTPTDSVWTPTDDTWPEASPRTTYFRNLRESWNSTVVSLAPSRAARKRRRVFTRDDFTCRDCSQVFPHADPYGGEGIPGLTLGHIIPRSKGGTYDDDNLIAQCLSCNQALADNVWTPKIDQEPGSPAVPCGDDGCSE